VTVSIGRVDAKVNYASEAPGVISGVYIQAIVPNIEYGTAGRYNWRDSFATRCNNVRFVAMKLNNLRRSILFFARLPVDRLGSA